MGIDSFAKEDCRLREVQCISVLNRSGLADYAVNCYAGCQHGCVYCYARFATRFSHPGEMWGSFVDIKVNAPQVLIREAQRKKTGLVFISSVCDGWQPSEAAYGLTRQCLEILLQYRYPVSVLTKSVLAGRDLDILASSEEKVDFGVTITTLDESLRELVEPGSSLSAERLDLLQEARRRGISTHAFLGPLMPYLSDTEANLKLLLQAIKDVGVDYFYVDRLNWRFGVWQAIQKLLREHFPDYLEIYHRLFFDENARREHSEWLKNSIHFLAGRYGLDNMIRLCF
jgi:DNA repair photolyase